MAADERAVRRVLANSRSADGFDHGYDGHFRRQVRLGLGLTYAERLRWLERTMDELRRIVGRAWSRS